MNAITLIVVIAVMMAARELVIGFYVWRSRRKYMHEYRIERTQSHFATARNELMRLAVAGEIDVNSKSFRLFYFLNTAVMRRPDQYTQVSQAIVGMLLSNHGDEPDEQLSKESKEWSPAVREVVKTTANAMNYLVLNYLWPIRFMFWLEKIQDPESTPHRMLSRLARNMEKKEKTVSEIRRTQKAMYMMASATV